jgi:hypothetical protein
VRQGAQIGRPSLLALSMDVERNLFVGGTVAELGRGFIGLP